jgi:hypothetical protein
MADPRFVAFFVLAALCTPSSPTLATQTLSHTPWWHARGHLSDYTTCQPGPEDDIWADLALLASGSQQRENRAVKGAIPRYRDEFLNVANEVPELAAVFLPEDVRAELLRPGRPSRLPLPLHAGSLHQRLSVLYWDQMAERSTEAASVELDTTLGYRMMRIWLDEVYGDLGGARGRCIVQRGMGDSGRFAVPTGLADEDEPSHFFLPDFLCQELRLDPHLQGPKVERGESKNNEARHVETTRAKEADIKANERPRKGKPATSRKARRKGSAA